MSNLFYSLHPTDEYFDAVTDVVIELLKLRLLWVKDQPWSKQAEAWSIWRRIGANFPSGRSFVAP